MKTLICGSVAYDTVMVFPGHFKTHILPDKVHMLNVSFLVPEMRREFGGCAGNIAYNLKLLGGEPVIMATVGADFDPYAAHMRKHGIDTTHIRMLEHTFTGQAFITTDLDDNQISAFHPGAMGSSHLNHVAEAIGVSVGIVSPDGRDGMYQHARQFFEAGIPFILDPGQGMPLFTGDALLQMVEWATYLALNDYEAELMQERTGLSLDELAQRVKALIVTRGGQGSTIWANGQCYDIPVARASSVQDPTGCGDAYRAGLLYGLTHRWDWEKTGRLASLVASIKIGSRGGQNHHFSRDTLAVSYRETFGTELWV